MHNKNFATNDGPRTTWWTNFLRVSRLHNFCLPQAQGKIPGGNILAMDKPWYNIVWWMQAQNGPKVEVDYIRSFIVHCYYPLVEAS